MVSTEQRSIAYKTIDTWPDDSILVALVDGQERAIAAVRATIPQISKAAEALAVNLKKGGRLFYAGAGTSIRIGVQDGSELPATFGMAEDKISYLIAGGRAAIFETLADAEDNAEEGAHAAAGLNPNDTLVAIAASGATPYTVAAAKQAKENGATVIVVVNNPNSQLAAAGHIEILLNSGAEVIAGSTRMGAGTAQKAALNLLSTLAHIKLGAVYDGLMVNVQADNFKLKKRARNIVSLVTGAKEDAAASALEAAKGEVKSAILLCAGIESIDVARQRLFESDGNLRLAMKGLAAKQ
jgi:N-acetylmuramic acid 6-phosphate etherase